MSTPQGPGLPAGIVILAALAAGATALLSLTDEATDAKRQENQAVYATRLLSSVIPEGNYDQPPGSVSLMVQDAELLGSAEPLPAYPLLRDGQTVGTVLTVMAPDGYVAPLTLLVGVDSSGNITGVSVTAHRETPGLGDKVERGKSDWITGFTGRSADDPTPVNWALNRDGGEFDHISGATITSRAVVKAVDNALKFFAANRATLLNTSAEKAD